MSLSNEDIIYEIKSTEAAIVKAIGVRPRYLRPPFGEADARVKALAKAMDYKILMWNVDPRDYDVFFKHQSASRITRSMKKVIRSRKSELNVHNDPGFISLQHDLYEKSINEVPKIIRALKKNNFKMTTVAECVDDAQPYGQPHRMTQADLPTNQTDHAQPLAREDYPIAAAAVDSDKSSLPMVHALNANQQNSQIVPLDESDANASDKASSTPHSVQSSLSSSATFATFSYWHLFSSLMVLVLPLVANFFF